MKKTKVAIACQGGGSQTAFTAGVLKAFFEDDLHHKKEIVSLTGTSGGAVCAALAWYGLLKAAQGDQVPIQERITAFWEDLAAQLAQEISLDETLAGWMRIIDRGVLPHFELSPASWFFRWSLQWMSVMLPRNEFTDLKLILEKHIDFGEASSLAGADSPALLVGAADVMTGELKIFNSLLGEIQVESILASAAVPSLFPAVWIGEHCYWDGLFSDNPPLKEVIRPRFVGGERVPDEIWVIQINPKPCRKVPCTSSEIIDRRNQMIGNISLSQSLEFIEMLNVFLREKALTEASLNKIGVTRRDPIDVHFIQMSDGVQECLDFVSKLTRGPSHIRSLIEDGERQGRAFLEERAL